MRLAELNYCPNKQKDCLWEINLHHDLGSRSAPSSGRSIAGRLLPPQGKRRTGKRLCASLEARVQRHRLLVAVRLKELSYCNRQRVLPLLHAARTMHVWKQRLEASFPPASRSAQSCRSLCRVAVKVSAVVGNVAFFLEGLGDLQSGKVLLLRSKIAHTQNQHDLLSDTSEAQYRQLQGLAVSLPLSRNFQHGSPAPCLACMRWSCVCLQHRPVSNLQDQRQCQAAASCAASAAGASAGHDYVHLFTGQLDSNSSDAAGARGCTFGRRRKGCGARSAAGRHLPEPGIQPAQRGGVAAGAGADDVPEVQGHRYRGVPHVQGARGGRAEPGADENCGAGVEQVQQVRRQWQEHLHHVQGARLQRRLLRGVTGYSGRGTVR